MKNKKVLFVATVVKKHINVFHLPYLKWFQEQGYKTHVAARDDFNGEECIILYCDKHFDIPFERLPLNKNNIKAYKHLKKIINENNYEIIHCHTPVAAILTRLAARKARKQGTKVIYTAHGFHFFKGASLINWLIYFPVEYICSFFTDILITINQEDYQLAKKVMKAKQIEYVPGVGIDVEKLKNIEFNKTFKRKEFGIPEDAIMLLSIGELSKRKNHQVVIEALALLKNSNVHYCIAGQGNLEGYLMNKIKSLQIKNQVHFLGFRKDIPELCKSADIFIFPSLQEGLPVALMEAMANEKACIVSKVRGNIDLIRDENFLVEPNDINGYVNCIKKLILDIRLRSKVGSENKKNLEKYNLNNILNQMERIYLTDKKVKER